MKKKFNISFFVLGSVFCIFFFTCKKDKPAGQELDYGYNYFPDEAGRYAIYEVDSIVYDDQLGPPDTVRYLLKERISSVFQDNAGRPTLRLERYIKLYNKNVPYDSISWSVPKIWTANRTKTTVEKKEENTVYMKLVFPPTEGRTWNGNSYNSSGKKEYEILVADKKETLNNIPFDSVLTVLQYEQTDFIQIRYEAEKYARNVGLVYKQRDSIYHGGDSITKKVGYRFKQKIITYGK